MSKVVDVIKYEGDNNTFVWKHPCEDFNSLTQLIVHESQEAIFFMNGQALDLFGPGRHTLETQNLPRLGGLFKNITGKTDAFHCEVYFINKTTQMSIKWGTDSRVRFVDPITGAPLDIGACGEMNIQVEDSRKLLVKLVGTTNGIAWGDEGKFTMSLRNSFRPLISTQVKAKLAETIKVNNIDILDIDQHLSLLSEELRKNITPGFEDYGLTIPQFYVTTVSLPEADPNFKKIKELHTIALQQRVIQAEGEVRTTKAQVEAFVTAAERQAELERQTTQTEIAKREAERKMIEAQAAAEALKYEGLAEAEIMRAKGYTEKDLIQADVQKAYAEGLGKIGANAGAGGGGGSAMSDILGLGLGLQAASAMGGPMRDMFNGFTVNNQQATPVSLEVNASANKSETVCAKCGNKLPANAKFCLECGTKVVLLGENEIICPECGAKTPKGKFCMECGAMLVKRCSNCGAEIPSGGKFCLECGTRV